MVMVTYWVNRATERMARLSRAHGCAGATLALHHHKRTLHAVQLIFLG
jgi:hypothetical protein